MTPRPPVVMTEYEERVVPMTAAEERTLRLLAEGRVTILPGDEPDTYRVKAGCHVGTLTTPAIKLLIKPKVTTANLFHLLEASGRALDLGSEVFDYDRTDDLLPAFATFFARHLEAAISRGIVRSYVEVDDQLAVIRGRVDLRSQRNARGLPLPVACRFDEHTADIGLNRVVRAAAVRLARLPGVTLRTRRALLYLIACFEDVGPLSEGDVRALTAFTRLNDHYRGVEGLARMVLDGSSLLDATGESGAAVFLVDMNKVFEQFVESRLQRHLAGRLLVRGHVSTWLDAGNAVRMIPDLVFDRPGDGTIYIADSKYKLTSDGYGREGDYYQLLAYTTALEVPEGVLIYCQHDGSAPPRSIDVLAARKRLRTWAVRLDRSVTAVEAEFALLAQKIACWSSPEVTVSPAVG